MLYAGMAALAGAAAVLIARSEYEKKHFVTERYRITTEKLPRGTVKNFVFLTDLHNNQFGKGNEDLIREIERIRPDAVLIGGDMMVSHGYAELAVTLDLVRRLAARFPVYYGNGNHEERMNREREVYRDAYDRFVKKLREAGVMYLSDESADFDDSVRITGCNMDEKYYRHHFTVPKLPEDVLERRVGKADGEKFQILLLHSPLFFGNCRRWGADLTLCGHFHGGTIRLPVLGGVMTPQYQFFLPWCAGRFDEEGRTMIVSRGLGTHSINIRLNDRPQLLWVTVEGGK